ncbi:MAG: glycosyltransferase family 4 protein [Lachnospiraceae bacterium]|nr:glycosyltransferase family 4 protein [Lachnospiraceae bacterium]
MVIVSDCLKNNLDEGCIKVASTFAKRLKSHGAGVIAVNCDCDYADEKISAGKTYSDPDLYRAISGHEGDLLYIPFASNTLGSAIRTFFLARKSRRKVHALFALRWNMNPLTKFLLKASGCGIVALSNDSYEFYRSELPKIDVTRIRAGVDLERFVPVSEEEKMNLRRKYGLPEDKTIVLHVGHLKHGRNIDAFLDLEDPVYAVLVFSAVTEKDPELKAKLEAKSNVRIMEEYLPDIEEIYQAADVYVFPVTEENNSIDVPLSVLEAAACNCRVVATGYKEIASFEDAPGFRRIKNDEVRELQRIISEVSKEPDVQTVTIARGYDWNKAIEDLQDLIDGKKTEN